jgi:murein DD-endopeptidase MepM/ murein hydrolase activator NlpD
VVIEIVRTFISSMVMLLLTMKVAYAEDASLLLKKYHVDTTSSAAIEEKKLSLVEDEYYKVAKVVNTNTMLSLATNVSDDYSNEKISEMDLSIYYLSDRLQKLESTMEESKNSDVETIIALDTEYRSVESLMGKRVTDRSVWVERERLVKDIVPPTEQVDRQELVNLSNQVEDQKVRVKKSTTYQELGDISNFRSPLEIPVYMTSPFGTRLDPVSRHQVAMHKGMDMRANVGTKVLSAFNGTVEEASNETAGGNYVIINHGSGIKTIYMHLQSFQVKPGQKVKQYEVIARSGNTGTSTTGPHLHFGVFINGESVDPAVFVPH